MITIHGLHVKQARAVALLVAQGPGLTAHVVWFGVLELNVVDFLHSWGLHSDAGSHPR